MESGLESGPVSGGWVQVPISRDLLPIPGFGARFSRPVSNGPFLRFSQAGQGSIGRAPLYPVGVRGARYHGQGSWAGECGSPGSLGKRGARELERASSQSHSARNCDIYPVPRRFPVARQPHSHTYCPFGANTPGRHLPSLMGRTATRSASLVPPTAGSNRQPTASESNTLAELSLEFIDYRPSTSWASQARADRPLRAFAQAPGQPDKGRMPL